jgi:hypothetical protein
MREPLTGNSLQIFMNELAGAAKSAARVYLVGGASAVLLGWRKATVDVDLKIIPEHDETLRALSRLKDQLKINIELASPDDFIPPLPGWQERSQFIQQQAKLAFYHYDFYAQALAKLERRHQQDRADVARMFETKLVRGDKLLELFAMIEGELHRYPQVDPESFRKAVKDAVRKFDPK